MKLSILLLILLALPSFSRTSGNVIQVKRKLRMSYLEPEYPKEFFLDLGARDGLKEGDMVKVYRQLPVANGQAGGAWHLLRVNISDLKVYFVGETTAIARQELDRAPASLPPMEYQSIMVGDEVDYISSLPTK